jgi:regulatory protein
MMLKSKPKKKKRMTQLRVNAAILGYLSRREHSRLELRQKLTKRGFGGELIEQALAHAEQSGMQSDARFAESFVRMRVRKGYGYALIAYQLAQRGIDSSVGGEFLGVEDWSNNLRELIQRKFSPQDVGPKYNKIVRYLRSRGHNHSDIYVELKNWGQELERDVE